MVAFAPGRNGRALPNGVALTESDPRMTQRTRYPSVSACRSNSLAILGFARPPVARIT